MSTFCRVGIGGHVMCWWPCYVLMTMVCVGDYVMCWWPCYVLVTMLCVGDHVMCWWPCYVLQRDHQHPLQTSFQYTLPYYTPIQIQPENPSVHPMYPNSNTYLYKQHQISSTDYLHNDPWSRRYLVGHRWKQHEPLRTSRSNQHRWRYAIHYEISLSSGRCS